MQRKGGLPNIKKNHNTKQNRHNQKTQTEQKDSPQSETVKHALSGQPGLSVILLQHVVPTCSPTCPSFTLKLVSVFLKYGRIYASFCETNQTTLDLVPIFSNSCLALSQFHHACR